MNSDLNSVTNSNSAKPQYVNKGRLSVSFKGNYMKQTKVVYPHKSVVNIYTVYELDKIDLKRNTDVTVKNALFGTVKITKDANTSHNKYKGYGICFDAYSDFSIGNINNGKNVIWLQYVS